MLAAAEKPELGDDVVRAWLREHYGLDGELEVLPGECDLNVKVSEEGGGVFVAKFSSLSGDLALLAAQNEVLELLGQRELAAVPKVLTSSGGETLVRLEPGGRACVGRVLTFVPGTILAECAPYSEALLRDLGATVGRLNAALAGYDHAAFHYRFDWDLAQSAAVVERYRDLIADHEVRAGVDQIHREWRGVVVPRLEGLGKSVIHNDANDYNLLAEGERITGVIDFGDMVHTYTICDLAIAMAYACLEADAIEPVLKEAAIGYRASMPISEVELDVLYPMLRMRLAVSACMGSHQMRLRPDDPYLAISQEPIRKTMPALMALQVDDARALLEEALR